MENAVNLGVTLFTTPLGPFSTANHSNPGGAGKYVGLTPVGPPKVRNFVLKFGGGRTPVGTGVVGSHDVGVGADNATGL